MDAINNNYSAIVATEKQIIHDSMIFRYLTAAVLVVVMYDAILTIGNEVANYDTNTRVVLILRRSAWFGKGLSQLRSYSTTSTGTARLRP